MALSLSRDGLLKATAVVLAGFWFLVAFAVRSFLRLRRAEANSGAGVIPRDLESGGPNDNEKPAIPTNPAPGYPPFSYPPPLPPNDDTNKPYTCIDCPLTFTHAYELADHMEDSHGWQQDPSPLPSPYTCIDCSATFTLNYHLRQHMQSTHGWHHGPTFPLIELACVDCPASFGDKASLRVHMEDTHSWFQDFIPSPPSPMPINANAMMKCTVNGCGVWCAGQSTLGYHKRYIHGIWEQPTPAPVSAPWSGYNGNSNGNNANAFPGYTNMSTNTTAPYIYNPPFTNGCLPQSNSTTSPWSSFPTSTSVKPNPTSNSGTLYPTPYSSVPAYPGSMPSNTIPSAGASPWAIYNRAQSPWTPPPSFTHNPAPTSPFYSPPSTPPLGSHIPRVKIPTLPSIPMTPPRTCAYYNCGRTFSSEEALSMHLGIAHDAPIPNLHPNGFLNTAMKTNTNTNTHPDIDMFLPSDFEAFSASAIPRPLSCVTEESDDYLDYDDEPALGEAADRASSTSRDIPNPKAQLQGHVQSQQK
ncbi:hypothetical protein C8F01DRAFT_1183123, partial [Mycena amicta]